MIRRLLPLLLVSIAVALNLLSAIVLKEAADMGRPTLMAIIGILTLVALINLFRVMFWAAIHRRFPLSASYPLTSIFFPMILIISALYGENIGTSKIVGTLFITLGVVVLIAHEDGVTSRPDKSTTPKA